MGVINATITEVTINAVIAAVEPVIEYMVPIWAEENGALANGSYQWAYGNGAGTGNLNGIVVYVPNGWTCTLVAMGLSLGATTTATVQAVINSVEQGSNGDVTVSSGRSAVNDSFTPVAITNGQLFNFKTTSVAGGGFPNQVVAWLRMVKS